MTIVEDGRVKTMAAGKFKAQCLSVMDEVQAKREPVLVTKNGKPVAQLVPVPFEGDDPIFGFYKGNLEILGDVMAPIYTDEEMEKFYEASDKQLLDIPEGGQE
jgi:prevent-host-death family protein